MVMVKQTRLYFGARALFIGVVIALGGCSSLPKEIPLADGFKAEVKGSSVSAVRQQTPGFMFLTPKNVLIESLTPVWADASGTVSWAALTAEHEIPDFTQAVVRNTWDSLTMRDLSISISASEVVEPFSNGEDFSALARKHRDYHYVLLFRTAGGFLGYGPLSWNTYELGYVSEMLMLSTSSGEVVWKVYCQIGPEEGNPLTFSGDDFLKGDGAKLRAGSAFVTEHCGRVFANALVSEFGVM